MKFDEETRTLKFASLEEANDFHLELTHLVRCAMVDVNSRVTDPEQAKELSRDVMKQYRTVMRALNGMRRILPRKA